MAKYMDPESKAYFMRKAQGIKTKCHKCGLYGCICQITLTEFIKDEKTPKNKIRKLEKWESA